MSHLLNKNSPQWRLPGGKRGPRVSVHPTKCWLQSCWSITEARKRGHVTPGLDTGEARPETHTELRAQFRPLTRLQEAWAACSRQPQPVFWAPTEAGGVWGSSAGAASWGTPANICPLASAVLTVRKRPPVAQGLQLLGVTAQPVPTGPATEAWTGELEGANLMSSSSWDMQKLSRKDGRADRSSGPSLLSWTHSHACTLSPGD